MKVLREIALLLRNTVLVTAAVGLGFWSASALNLPQWLWIPCLLPAGYLFLKLSKTNRPLSWKLLGFFPILTASFAVYSALISPHLSTNYQTLGLALMGTLNVTVILKASNWLERRHAKQAAVGARPASFIPQ